MFFRVKLLNGQARYIKGDRYALAVRKEITDDKYFPGVSEGFVGAPTVWAVPGNEGWLRLRRVVGPGFLEIGDVETGELEDIDGHSDKLPQPSSRKRWFGGADKAFGRNSEFLMQISDHVERQRALAVENFINAI